MIKSEYFRTRKGIFFAIGLLVFLLSLSPKIFAQVSILPPDPFFERHIPTAPDVQNMKIYGNIEINKAKGLPNISIPLYTLQVDGVSIPIQLSYGGNGIKVNDVGGSVGMNWNLSYGGMIYRTVRGKPDERSTYGWFNCQSSITALATYFNSQASYQSEIEYFYNQPNNRVAYDDQPDEFGYQLGSYSGVFFFDQNKELRKKTSDPLKIGMSKSIDNLGNATIDFTITDEWGNIYYFGTAPDGSTKEQSEVVVSSSGGTVRNWTDNGTSTWRLEKITTNKGRDVNFAYIPYDNSQTLAGVQELSYMYVSHEECSFYYGNMANKFGSNSQPSQIHIKNVFKPLLISSISSDIQQVDFKYITSPDDSKNYQIKLDSIKITDLITSTKKGFKLNYIESEKCFLGSIKEFDSNLSSVGAPTYNIEYNNTDLVPELDSKAQDFFGYYNGQINNTSLLVFPSYITTYIPEGNRKIYSNALQQGIITAIQYPTGGYTNFEWEPNFEKKANNVDSLFASGLRIKRIYNSDKDGRIFSDRQYIYSSLKGYTITQGQQTKTSFVKDYRTSLNTEGYCEVLSSDPKISLSNVTDYYYQKIEEYIYDQAVIKTRITEQYNCDTLGTAYNTYMTSQIIEKFVNNAYSTVRMITNLYNVNRIWHSPYYTMKDTEMKLDKPFYTLMKKNITISNPKLISQTTTEYEGSTTDPIITNQGYEYYQNGLIWIKSTTTPYETTSTKYQYPFNISSTTYSAMSTLNMLNFPIEQISYKNGKIVGSQLNLYTYNWNYVPYTVYILETTTPLSSFTLYNGVTKDANYSSTPEVTYLNYDNYGNIGRIVEKNGKSTEYTWDETKNFLMAKIEKLSSFESRDKCYSDSKEYWTSINTINPNGIINTYCHHPLFGLKNQTNANGITTYYTYDPFGRLSEVRDDDGNLLKKNTYNYANN